MQCSLNRVRQYFFVLFTFLFIFAGCGPKKSLQISKWHTLTLDFQGPETNEKANDPNPFLDYCLDVAFTHKSGKKVMVPGFYDGDGNGKGQGNIWRVRFTPDETGTWTYKALFSKGKNIAVDLDDQADTSAGYFDGQTGTFHVTNTDSSAPGFLKWGRLEDVGGFYLKFKGGPYWIKGGADSPENLLAYAGFDDTPASHSYQAHISDWQPGDPDWGNGAGKGIIGALNYMAEHHVNSIYFLTMNIGGDGQDVWPFAGQIDPKGHPDNDNTHYDISKLTQWETVFQHAQRKGIHLHFVFNEAEEPNKRELDDAELGVERKLFYREMIARFGHHLSLQWNLSEEYDLHLDLTPTRIKDFAEYIHQVDPYDHPITVHNCDNTLKVWEPFIGDKHFPITSLQYYAAGHPEQISYGDIVEQFRRKSSQAGRPLSIFMDEFYEVKALDVDTLYQRKFPYPTGFTYLRKNILWPVYLSGGGGVEYIFLEKLATENYHPYEKLWQYTWYARKFMQDLPFWQMQPADELVTHESAKKLKANVLALADKIYAIYIPDMSLTWTLDFQTREGQYLLRWYNPRTGEFSPETKTITGGKQIKIVSPPDNSRQDWVVLLTAYG